MINLFVNNTLVDLSEDFDLLITRSIADIKNPEQRSSDWSKTAKIPGTKTNNILFGGIFEVEHTVLGSGQFAPNFNPNKKADVVVLVDGFEQLRGFIRLIQINVLDHDFIEYECSLHGQTADLFTTLGNAKLSELDFGEYNHVLTDTNVTNSWDTSIVKNNTSQAFAYGEGYVYAQMLNKYGSQNTNTNQWRVDDHIPCLYAKTIVDKIMSNIGYQYTSDSFFTSDRFKRLIIPYTNFGFTSDETALQTRLFQAQLSTSQTIVRTAGAITATTLAFNNDSTGGNFDNGGNYNTSTYQYTAPISGTFDFFLSLQSSFDGTAPYSSYASMSFFVYKNGLVVKTIDIDSNNVSTTHWDFDGIGSCQISCVVGDTIQIKFIQTWFDGVSPILGTNTINSTTQFYNHVSASTLAYNNPLDFGLFFSGDFTQKDLLINFVKMFNLYIEQDMDNAKKLRFVPRDDFYNGTTQDWTSLVDYSQNVQIVPMGDLEANPYIFTYKEGEDFYNKEYKQSTSKIYGDRIVRVDNDFVKQEKKIEITFSPTMLLASGNRYYSTILNGNNDKGQLRCLYFGGVKNTSAYEVYNTTLTNVPNFSKYPLTLHIDDTDNMQFDLNFGMSNYILADKGLEFSNQNLVNSYWFKTIREITDKNSKVFKGYFRINPYQWANIQFKDLYFFEGQYWRLNKITDYNPLQEGVYLCEFLLVTYYEPSTSNKKNVGVGATDILNDRFPFGKPIGFTGVTTGGVNIGDSGLDSKDNITVGNDHVSQGRFANTILGGTQVNIPINFESVTAINCDTYSITESNRFYVENFPQMGAYSCGGNVIEIDHTDSPYTSLYDDYLIVCDMTGNISIVLPNPSTNKGKIFVVKKLGSPNTITVTAGDGSILIDTSTSHTITNNKEAHQFISTGTQYYVIVP
jgi:hypothetical protein